MPTLEEFDAIVIGAGQAGPSLAGRLTAAGMKIACIERHKFGGTCVNTGCTPTKTLVASADVAYKAHHAAEFGVLVDGIKIDWTAVRRRKDAIVGASRTGVEGWLRGMPGCTVIQGHARFESPHTLRVGDRWLSSRQIFINVGGRAQIPDFRGLERVSYLTNSTLLDLETVPRHLVIVGGGYIGLEFAQMFRRFGSEVTLVEKGERLLSREDEDISAEMQSIIEAEGVHVRTDAECIALAAHGEGVEVLVDCEAGDRSVLGSHVLVAVGRRPNTDDLGAERAGLALDESGYLVVDDELRTSVEGIWALGDCNRRGAFTHTAYNDFEIVADNVLGGHHRSVRERIPCYGVFIDPPLGRVGLTERQAQQSKLEVCIAKRPMTRVNRAREKGETRGFMKVMADPKTQQILGAAILGVGGDEAIHGILDAMAARMSYVELRKTVHIHPTVSELIPTLLADLP
jgi:pyruvate/2-oxoglutarate dehydrogenase complex dihydrolipoamide dehydrogenase (E3) component